ncbi:hypothetical protein FNV43_RR13087 [Rhamnella rubrinervis]|uniref:Uncharacterized protein n=1 Tax=Rhamnella rubrinervis TaxID=2594499 RepID=A0A8K0MEM3_9ROSA|nr:hypothetical protein FNV43_RR13087 [Rhamnella rubrinervis]
MIETIYKETLNKRFLVGGKFIRLKAKISIKDPLPVGFFQTKDNGEEYWVQFKYECEKHTKITERFIVQRSDFGKDVETEKVRDEISVNLTVAALSLIDWKREVRQQYERRDSRESSKGSTSSNKQDFQLAEEIIHLIAKSLDHNPILLNTEGSEGMINRPFRYFKAWSLDKKCFRVVRKAWTRKAGIGMETHKTVRMLVPTSKALKKWNREHFGYADMKTKELEQS